jgi:cholest-4-en-3-one 26-monooxygenase
MIGADDPDFHSTDVDGVNDSQNALIELFTYFAELLKEKQKAPDESLLTLLSQMEVDGKKLEELEALSYCLALVVAGNETTRNATSGGMLALIEHPGQLQRLQADPSLLNSAIEEMLRWTSPLIHFARTASQDTELSGVPIKKGDTLALFYPSANRDSEVFSDPYTFDIGRSPNNHLAFGVGEHFCLGAHLARLELVAAFKHLLPRLESVELSGPVKRLRSNLVGGIKELPIRYRLRAA